MKTKQIKKLKLQYLAGGGMLGSRWLDVESNRNNEFIDEAAEFNKCSTDEIIHKLQGEEIKYDSGWDDKIRIAQEAEHDFSKLGIGCEESDKKCPYCGKSINSNGHPSAGVCDNI